MNTEIIQAILDNIKNVSYSFYAYERGYGNTHQWQIEQGVVRQGYELSNVVDAMNELIESGFIVRERLHSTSSTWVYRLTEKALSSDTFYPMYDQPAEPREPIHATPEQLQLILALAFAMKIETAWLQKFYAQHARFYSNRLDATYTQAQTMIEHLEALHASIEAMDTKLAYEAFSVSVEIGKRLGFERGQYENARIALDVSHYRTRDYTQLNTTETQTWFIRADRYARTLATFAAEFVTE